MSLLAAVNGSRTIEDRIKEVVSENLGVATEDIKLESKFVDDLGADSLDTVELIMSLEDEFEMEIPDDDAEKWSTVQDVLTYMNEKAPK